MRRALLAVLLAGAVMGIGAPVAGATSNIGAPGAAPNSSGAEGSPSTAGASEAVPVEIGTALQITRGDATAHEPDPVTVFGDPVLIAATKPGTLAVREESDARRPLLVALVAGGVSIMLLAGLFHWMRRRNLQESRLH